MILILELLNLVVYFPFLKPDEEDIGRNVNQLKKYDWFQNLLQNAEQRVLVIHNQKVRQTIGRLNTSKIERMAYNEKSRRKINRALQSAA